MPSKKTHNPTQGKPVVNGHGVKQSALGVLNWLDSYIGHILLGVGAVGTIASLALAIEEFQLLKHPAQSLGCDLNPIINCGANMQVWQGHVFFGMPNAFLGLMMFVAIMTIGAAIIAGARLKRWFWLGLVAGMTFGVLFAHWFIFESIFVLEHLCPYCMVTWVVTITGFWYLTLYAIREGYVRVPASWAKVSTFAQRHHADILAVWFLGIIVLILQHFWYYWSTLL